MVPQHPRTWRSVRPRTADSCGTRQPACPRPALTASSTGLLPSRSPARGTPGPQREPGPYTARTPRAGAHQNPAGAPRAARKDKHTPGTLPTDRTQLGHPDLERPGAQRPQAHAPRRRESSPRTHPAPRAPRGPSAGLPGRSRPRARAPLQPGCSGHAGPPTVRSPRRPTASAPPRPPRSCRPPAHTRPPTAGDAGRATRRRLKLPLRG